MLRLYDNARASASCRVRIALNLKGLAYETVPVSLAAGEQHGAAYRAVNPQGIVPSLETGTGEEGEGGILTQSLAILEWLEEAYPRPPLLPAAPLDRARVRALAAAVAMEIHPIQSLRVRTYLREGLEMAEEGVAAWMRHWIGAGLADVQALAARAPVQGRYCYGDAVTLADVMLVPQMANARRFGCDLAGLDRLVAIDAALRALPAVARALDPSAPARQ